MRRWFTADFNLGNTKIIKRCDRPFDTIEYMNDFLIEVWNDSVRPDDIVFFLGNFSASSKISKMYTKALNGRKMLIAGTKDGCFRYQPRIDDLDVVKRMQLRHDDMIKAYMDDGWERVSQSAKIVLSNGSRVLLSHLPYAPDVRSDDNKQYLEYRPKDEGLILLHGHSEGRYRKYRNCIDVGIDGDYHIWSESEVCRMIKENEYFIPTPLTDFYKGKEHRNVFRTG